MVIGRGGLPLAGRGRVCARTLGLLLDPGGGAVERSYCMGVRGEAETGRECHRKGKEELLMPSDTHGQPSVGCWYSLIRLL